MPTSIRLTPSSTVVRLLRYLKDKNVQAGRRALDIGCGAGRNSFYLAENGYEVTAIDFARAALDHLQKTLDERGGRDRITIQQCDLTNKLPFEDGVFDLAIDIVTTCSLNPEEMRRFERELKRILVPNGIYLSYIHSRDDRYLAAVAPGQTSYTIEGLMDYTWTEDELRTLYKDWDVLALEKVEKQDDFYGKTYIRSIWWILLKNKK
ncbi:MAG TPA: class I SAM-dependent methyltransferase [Ktedonobacteraceae bacterium]|nr:class I SAM-dependent methyltransferase [Ktedonobacteraceae bacterium]